MKKGFTIVEVSILFVIFIIVAFLVAPMSLDDTMQAKNTSRWRTVQSDFVNIFYSINTQEEEIVLKDVLDKIIGNEVKSTIPTYKITFLNGTFPNKAYRFDEYLLTYSNATIAYKIYEIPEKNVLGKLMYDVNGPTGPNIWGRDVFGFDIYKGRFIPFGKGKPLNEQKQDCSKTGTGLFCSNYYLIGGDFE